MLNHDQFAKVTYISNEKTGFFALQVNNTVQQGCQFFNNYRHRSNEKLLLNYGFTCDDNPLDSYTVKIGLHKDADPLYDQKRELLDAANLTLEHYITRQDPVPASLLHTMRILNSNEDELYFWNANRATDEPVSVRNEVTTLTLLKDLLMRQLHKLAFQDFGADLALIRSGKLGDPMRHIVAYRAGQAQLLADASREAVRRLAEYEKMSPAVHLRPRYFQPARYFASGTQAMEQYNAWARDVGIFVGGNVAYSLDADGLPYLAATAPIQAGDVVLRFPQQQLLGMENLSARVSYELRQWLCSARGHRHLSQCAIGSEGCLVVLLWRESKRTDSPWKHFFQGLPTDFKTAVTFPDEELECLEGTYVYEEALNLRNQYAEELADIGSVIPSRLLSQGASPRTITPDEYTFFKTLVQTHVPANLVDPAYDQQENPVMLPLPLMPRHHPYIKLSYSVDPADGAVIARTRVALRHGDEVYDGWGSDQTHDHVLYAGACFSNETPNPIPATLPLELQVPEDGLYDLRVRCLDKFALGTDHFLSTTCLAPSLLSALRVLLCDDSTTELQDLLASDSTTPPGYISTENEAAVRENLRQLIDGLSTQMQQLQAPAGHAASSTWPLCAVYLDTVRAILAASAAFCKRL
eukprot:TRINITY_DN4225_c1_g1_i3.p1 TRINITY_DN4225_c1_g1~~TRINITY_DN4225_c1_g1_i3.p1  ORF type:complete len:638 (+),score=140.23 TRINITY_DN4225_c1_g1_i3:907-2820(+)